LKRKLNAYVYAVEWTDSAHSLFRELICFHDATQPDPPTKCHRYFDSTNPMALDINNASLSKRYDMTDGKLHQIYISTIIIIVRYAVEAYRGP